MLDKYTIENLACVVNSICPPDVSTSIDTEQHPRKIAVELELGRQTLNVSVGQRVEVGDVIGTIGGVPAESIARFDVSEIGPNWITGDYVDVDDETYNEQYVGSIMSGGSDFDSVTDVMAEYTHVNSFIKDYMLGCQYPRLAAYTKEHTSGNGKELSMVKFSRTYDRAAKDIIEDLNKKVQNICDPDKLKSHAENGTSQEVKDEIDSERNTAFNKIISLYRNVGVNGCCSKGSVGDFMLYEYYVTYLTSDEFVYDDDNPYVIELFNYITERIGVRSRLELNSSSISDEIVRFNEAVSNVLGTIWDPTKDKDYYAEMRKSLKYDFYVNDTDDVEAQISDKGRVSLYSKALDHLKSLVSYRSPDSKRMTVTATTKGKDGNDVETSVEIDKKADTDEVLSMLKKIAVLFCRLRKFEIGAKSTKEYSQYIGSSDLDNIFTLRKKMGEKYVEDYSSYDLNTLGSDDKVINGTVSEVYGKNNDILKKYLSALKSVTDEECKRIGSICDKVISWYSENHESIDNYSIFSSMKRISWPSPSVIHKDGCDCDFYLLTENPPTASVPSGYEFSETSLATEYNMGDYMYWLRYLGIASAMNCALPIYWSTGLVVAGAPVSLPIILLPVFVIPGRVLTVICIGMCGLAIYPTILFANLGSIFGCIIPMVNSMVDMVKQAAQKKMSDQFGGLNAILYPSIAAADEAINKCNDEIRDYNEQIRKLRAEVKLDKETMRAVKKKLRKTSTMKAIKKGDE